MSVFVVFRFLVSVGCGRNFGNAPDPSFSRDRRHHACFDRWLATECRRRLPKQRRTVPHCEEGYGPTLQEGPLVASVVLQRLVLPLIVEEIVQVVQICQSSVIEVIALCASLVVVRPAHVVVFGVAGPPWDKPSGGAWVPRV